MVKFMVMRLFFFTLLLVLPTPLRAQVCHVSEVTADPLLLAPKPAFLTEVTSWVPRHVGIAFHILHIGGEENIPLGDLQKQIDVLNDAYSGTGFSFYLALVTRTYNPDWFQLNALGIPPPLVRNTLSIAPTVMINIYVGDMAGEAVGWSVFADSAIPEGHAIALDYVVLPDGPPDPHFDSGLLLVHEVGHYMGLRHPYERGCLEDTTKGDKVADTPASSENFFRQCPVEADTCPNLPGNDPVGNFMHSTTDACRMSWTPGQIDRMEALVTQFRPHMGGTDIALSSSITVGADTELYLYEGTYSFPAHATLTVKGRLHAQDVTLTTHESTWGGVHFTRGSKGVLERVDIAGVGGGAGRAGVSIQQAEATLDEVSINVLPGSYVYGVYSSGRDQTVSIKNSTIRSASGEAIYVSGERNRLFLFNTHVKQESTAPAIQAADKGEVHFWKGPRSPYVGYNRIEGGNLYATQQGLIHAGSASNDRARNHFCDALSTHLETDQEGKIFASHNYWYNGTTPLQIGSNILFAANQGEARCDVPPTGNNTAPTETGATPSFKLTNHPNPFNPMTVISFELADPAHVVLEIYDLLGRPIRMLTDEFKEAGLHTIPFDATGLPSGTYLYRLITPTGVEASTLSVVQ